ncbi:MAG: hypothetical protein M1816_005141 [Peltula sp. TS41687]|nr:MAG: hypothetical protein M1816_005141 [Peltula sp. TS41687]
MDPEEGQVFIKNLAYFVRTHERALANALQLRRQPPRHGQPPSPQPGGPASATQLSDPALPNLRSTSQSSTSSVLAAAFSLPSLNFTSHNIKPAKLSLTPHHLFYLLSRFEELGIPVGPMNVRLESINAESVPGNYVSFLSQSQRMKGRGSDRDSIHSVSSVRSVISGMSFLWSSLGIGSSNSSSRSEKVKAATQADLKYLYSAFTKIPCLRLAPDRKARLIKGYEEFPFDTAVPLWAFKNVSALEVCDIDIRQFFGWDRMADQLRSLTVKRAGVEDPADLLINIVLDDLEKRRRRSSKSQYSPTLAMASTSPSLPHAELPGSYSAPGSPSKGESKLGQSASPQSVAMARGGSEGSKAIPRPRPRSRSPSQPAIVRMGSGHGHVRGGYRLKRSGSGSSTSSSHSIAVYQGGSSSNLLSMVQLPSTKWRFLKHLSIADNSLTSLTASSLSPLTNTLSSLDLSSNLFTQIPDCLATLTALRALNLSNCMLDSLHSLTRNPLPAIAALNLRSNRLTSIAGIERLPSLERLDIRDNKLRDPVEIARLTGIPDIHEVWVADNPFTKTHSNYRITIFNLFRETPGHREDIIVDGLGPTYGEKKLLVNRTSEPPIIPVVTAQPASLIPSVVETPAQSAVVKDRSTRDKQLPEIPTGLSTENGLSIRPSPPVSSRSHRRRRGPRRRIVELSRSDIGASPEELPFASPSNEADPYASIGTTSEVNVPESFRRVVSSDGLPSASTLAQTQHLPRLDTGIAPPLAQTQLMMPIVGNANKEAAQDWNISSEIYRKKIEALKNEVGNGWLSVLSEGGWDGARSSQVTNSSGEFSPASTIRPSPTTPKGSQPILSGGRTLG